MKRHSPALSLILAGFGFLILSGETLGGEPAKTAYSPVKKPDPVPEELKQIFSDDAKVELNTKLDALMKLAAEDADEDLAEGLRWLIHQPKQNENVKEASVHTLMNWRRQWLARDLISMLNDPLQPVTWRGRCVHCLAIHHDTDLDVESWDAIMAAKASKERPIRDIAILEIGRLCGRWKWEATNPKKYKIAVATTTAALKDPTPSTLAAGLRAVMFARLQSMAPIAEREAGNAKQLKEVRVAALNAMASVPRWQSLPVLKACLKDKEPAIVQAANLARPFVLVAQLDHEDPAIVKESFQALTAMGEKAFLAVETAMGSESAKRRTMAKAILGSSLKKSMMMKPFDSTGMKVFGADPEKGKVGVKTILYDPKTKRVSIEGKFALQSGPLEYAVVCDREGAKLHESAIALDCSPMDICYALLACNYTYAPELRDENGKVNLPKGAGIMFSVEYEDTIVAPDGKQTKKTVRMPLQAFIWNGKTRRPMLRAPWAFTGSRMEKLPSGKRVLMVMIEKSVVAIKNDPNALLNNPLDTAALSDVNPQQQGAFYEMNRALAPKRGTKCKLIFEPWGGQQESFSDLGPQKNVKREKKK